MTVLFDINHPAHVHYFKNSILQLKKLGHKVVVVSRNKEFEHALLKANGIEFISRGTGAKSFVGRFFYHIYAVAFIYSLILLKKVNLVVSFMHPYAAQAAFLTGKKAIIFSDTETAKLHHKLTLPFVSEIHTGHHFAFDLGRKHHRFNGFMELAYLHPSKFKPIKNFRKELGIQADKKLILIRFISRNNVHDFHHPGLNDPQKIELVNELSGLGRVLISSEIPLPKELERFRLKIQVSEIHNILCETDLFVGESATMAAESAILGTPSLYIDNEGRGYLDWLKNNFDHVYQFEETNKGIQECLDVAKKILTKSHDRDSIRRILETNFNDQTEYILNQILVGV